MLAVSDLKTGSALVDMILDTAGQKGTGRWTSQNALDLGTPIPTIDAAVGARMMSARKEERVAASTVLTGPDTTAGAVGATREQLIATIERALYFAKISSYAQGMALLRAASDEFGWDLDLSEIARIWTGGCIIRAALLASIQDAFASEPAPVNLLVSPAFAPEINATAPAIRNVVGRAAASGIPVQALSAALNYVDAYRSGHLPANLIQALRDNFGAHTYQRIDRPGVFHTDWETGDTVEIL